LRLSQCVADWKYYQVEKKHEQYDLYHGYCSLGYDESEKVVNERTNDRWSDERHINRQQPYY